MNLFYFVERVDGTAAIVESAEYPGMAGLSSCSGGQESVALLREKYGLHDACSLCGAMYSTGYTNDVKTVLLEKNICFNCWFWTEHIQPNQLHALVIDGRHYTVGDEKDGGPFRGIGGRRVRIRKNDGTEIVTTNLWHQGMIPAHLRDRYPDNAVFLGGAGFSSMGGGYAAFSPSEKEKL